MSVNGLVSVHRIIPMGREEARWRRNSKSPVDVITATISEGLESARGGVRSIFSGETVERFMAESLEALGHSPLKDFVQPLARERLRALGQVEGTIGKQVPELLFVCVQNAGRSQMPLH